MSVSMTVPGLHPRQIDAAVALLKYPDWQAAHDVLFVSIV